MDLSSLLKDTDDELEDLRRIKGLFSSDELVLVHHLHVEDIVDKAEKKVYLTDEDKNFIAHIILQKPPQNRLENH